MPEDYDPEDIAVVQRWENEKGLPKVFQKTATAHQKSTDVRDAPTPPSPQLRLLTSEQAGELLQINPRALERMAARGEAPGFKLGKFWRYREADLLAWIEQKAKLQTTNYELRRANDLD